MFFAEAESDPQILDAEEDAHGAQRSEGDGGGASGRATRGLLVNRGGEGREQPREIFRLDE